jgi:crossover junction endodeoxyribonuclease RuvC
VIYIGIDPGLSGGLATISANGAQVTARPMPVSGGQIDASAVADLVWGAALACGDTAIAVMEKVGAMPKQGVVSMFRFGQGYGTILGVLGALGIRCELVTPQRWKAVILAGTARDKAAAIAWCRRAYPGVSLRRTERCTTDHDGMADALCLAEYGRRSFT